jgi:hypothetical protein
VRRARAAGVGLGVAAGLAPASAHAAEVSTAEYRALLADRDVEELRTVTSIDGQPVDIGGALQGATGDDLEQRLRTLESIKDVPAGGLGDPTGQARDILQQERFHGGETPGPFRDLIDWLKDRAPGNVFDWLDGVLPGDRSVVWIMLGALLAFLGYLLARYFLNRRIALSETAAEAHGPAADDPKTLERRAAEAEAAGDLEAALRLRFRAGLLRLDRRGAIAFRPSISTHEVRRALRSDDFDEISTTFDDVVYGGREPHTEDVAQARERWPDVVSSARGRE